MATKAKKGGIVQRGRGSDSERREAVPQAAERNRREARGAVPHGRDSPNGVEKTEAVYIGDATHRRGLPMSYVGPLLGSRQETGK